MPAARIVVKPDISDLARSVGRRANQGGEATNFVALRPTRKEQIDSASSALDLTQKGSEDLGRPFGVIGSMGKKEPRGIPLCPVSRFTEHIVKFRVLAGVVRHLNHM